MQSESLAHSGGVSISLCDIRVSRSSRRLFAPVDRPIATLAAPLPANAAARSSWPRHCCTISSKLQIASKVQKAQCEAVHCCDAMRERGMCVDLTAVCLSAHHGIASVLLLVQLPSSTPMRPSLRACASLCLCVALSVIRTVQADSSFCRRARGSTGAKFDHLLRWSAGLQR